MARKLHLDWETFSEADLKAVGAFRYAQDPSTEILIGAMAFDGEEPVSWDCTMEDWECDHLRPYWDALKDPTVLIVCHSAQFEMAICLALLMKTWGIPCPDLSRFRCTMSLARRAALPASLDKLSETLSLTQSKDKKGKALIKKFCEMQAAKKPTKKNPEGLPVRRIYPKDEPEAFAEFVQYCLQDVRAEQEVDHRLAYFSDDLNNLNYSLDARINARGVPVNVKALQHAQKLIEEETEVVSAKFYEIVGLNVTQNAELLKWVNANGYSFDNLQAETVDTFLDEREDVEGNIVVDALRLKQSIAYASIKKVKTMLDCVGPYDEKIRGMLNHHGAATGRWTASKVQWQNMKRPTIKHTERAYADICAGMSRDMVDICYGAPLEVISSCIRHFVQPAEGMLLDADYAAIEARIVCWLAGQEDALAEYRAYDAAVGEEAKMKLDRYRIMAAGIYRIPLSSVQKFPHRALGKETILGCGFGMGPDRFRDTCKKKKIKLSTGQEVTAVKTWRTKHKKVVDFWYAVEKAAKNAILRKGQIFKVGEHLHFLHKDIEGMPFLLMRLPSGRKLAYPRPRISNDRIVFFGNYKGEQWGDVSTWGGSLIENATQAVAADIMANGCHNAENAGYETATLIHDQDLSYHYPERGQTVKEFVRLLTDLPSWAKNLPIEAEGSLVPFYRKD